MPWNILELGQKTMSITIVISEYIIGCDVVSKKVFQV